jgi:ABC-type lipoprotein release transport system permease subunit
LTVFGSPAGLGAAVLLTKFLKSLLYGVAPRDSLTMAVAVLGLAAVVASILPARRAAAVDPAAALRSE